MAVFLQRSCFEGHCIIVDNEINKVENLANQGYLGHYYYANQGATNIVGGEIEGQYRPPGFAFDGSFVMTYAMHDKNESFSTSFTKCLISVRDGIPSPYLGEPL